MARLLIFAVVSLVLASAGCAQGPPDQTGEARPRATEATSEQTRPRTSSPEPPNATIAFRDQRETGELGGYCWAGACTEATLVVPPEGEALDVPSGSELLFEYGGDRPPSKVEARGYPLVHGKVDRNARRLRVTHPGARTRVSVELPHGEYAVELLVRVPEGSAFYYFRAAVDMVSLPTSGAPGGRNPKDR